MTALPAYTFDRLTYVDRLRNDAGLDEKTARAHADALDHALRDAVATKQDIAEVKTDLAEVEAGLKIEIERLEARTVAGITQVRTELKAEIALVRTDIEKVRTDIAERMRQQTVWLAATIVGAAGLAITIAKLF